jgi:hypothetical protein
MQLQSRIRYPKLPQVHLRTRDQRNYQGNSDDQVTFTKHNIHFLKRNSLGFGIH